MTSLKHTLLLALCLLFAAPAFATHIVGGGITYECLGNAGNGKRYKFTMKVYRDCLNGNAQFDNPASIAIYSGTEQSNFLFDDFNVSRGEVVSVGITAPDCIDNLPMMCLEEATYTWESILPTSNESYFIVYQRCCRTNAITNILIPGDTGATYSVEITPAAQQGCNNSPVFNNFPPVVICNNYPLEVDYSATDADGDQLVYSFCAPYAGGGPSGFGCSATAPSPPCPPPFDEVTFIGPAYSAGQPMGGNPVININSNTGVITGTPHMNGQFVVGVCVQEFRNGQLLSVTRRDFQFNVADCAPQVTALVDYDEISGPQHYVIKKCTGSQAVTIINESTAAANISSFEWNFDLNNGNFIHNTTDFNLTAVFPALGTYNGTLILNKGLDCGDTAYIQVQLYAPASLELGPNFKLCKDSTIVFNAGPNFASYQWQNGSTGQTFSASSSGLYHVLATDHCGNQLRDSVLVTITPIPDIQLSNVSLCPGESVTLTVPGFDQYSWSPGSGLSCSNCATVVITPAASTVYTLTGTNTAGCSAEGSFQATVLPTPMITRIRQLFANQTITLGGQVYSAPNTVTLTVPSTTGGCDSLNTYILQLLPSVVSIDCPANVTVALPNDANSVVVSYNDPAVTTDCPGVPPTVQLIQGLASGAAFPQGLNTVCYEASTTCGDHDTCCFTVKVTGLEFQCPANVTVALPSNANTTVVNYGSPSAATDCPDTEVDLNLLQGLPTGASFPAGINKVCYEASTSCGSRDTCCFNVHVTSLEITCPANVTVALPNNTTTTVVNYTLPTATTDCPGAPANVQLQQGLASGGNFPAGVNNICYEATTTCGNQDACCFTVTVTTLDIQCPANITVQLPVAAVTVPVTYNLPTTSGNCTSPAVVNLIQGLSSGSGFALGLNKVCYEGSNACGNRDTCCFNIMVLDAPKPCDIKNIGCMRFELLDIRLDSITQRRYRIRATNFCASEVDYIAIQLPIGVVAVTPKEGGIYTAPNTSNQYLIRNPNASPFYSIRYRSVATGLNNGQADVLEYRLPQQSQPDYIHIGARLKNGEFYPAHLNTFYCPVQPWAGSKDGAGTRDDEFDAENEEEAIFEAAGDKLSVRPNPTEGLILVDLSEWQDQPVQLRIMNAQGQVVLDRHYNVDGEWLELNLDANLSNGLYYLVVQPDGGATAIARFVLQR